MGRQLDGIHPDLRRQARFLPSGAFTATTIPLLRGVTRLMERRVPDSVTRVKLPSGGAVRVHRTARSADDGPALLWMHGGGYVIGSAAQDDGLCARFAAALGITVVSVDYRLAPRNPYPAALDDCHEALVWAAELPGVDAENIVIAGASAGGGLTAALALAARDRGVVTPRFQVLVYPMVDDRAPGSASRDDPRYRMWNPRSNDLGWKAYLRGADPTVAAPARRTDLAGVAPAWIGVGSLDPLHDEDIAYAYALRAAGVSCDVDVVDGAFHGFDAVAPKAPVSVSFFERQCEVIRAALG
ncbi:alpha/beta hydrolase [uncultured Williamsia sp.]|uniref:alpha/beta hydrolase n=1 Tax=uncultured Williamsia sp. TaxID=259311 RepID=UPI00262F8FA7|nr:alpha/beta hydrolase [uncultured Williamsia sp.]